MANVQTLLATITGELGAIEKLNPAQRRAKGLPVSEGVNYAYRGIEEISEALRPLLAKHGVTIAPTMLSHHVELIEKGGKPWTRTTLVVSWRLYGPEGDFIEAMTIGEGDDNSDKGSNKAMTAARKNLYLAVFCIAGGDDPDHEKVPTDKANSNGRSPKQEAAKPKDEAELGAWAKANLSKAEFENLKVAYPTEYQDAIRHCIAQGITGYDGIVKVLDGDKEEVEA